VRRTARKASSKASGGPEPEADDLWGRLRKVSTGAMPFARVRVSHSMIAALHHYSLSAVVKFRLKGSSDPKPFIARPIFEQNWSRATWDFFLSTSVPMREYTFYQDAREQASVVCESGVVPPKVESTRCWKSEAAVRVSDARRRHERKIPCNVMTETYPDERYVLRFPADARKATLCAQVLLELTVPYRDDKGMMQAKRVGFIELPEDVEVRRYPSRDGKRTPFNCDNPACDGVMDGLHRCLEVPLAKESFEDAAGEVKVDISSSVPHAVTIPFMWGHSLVRADVHVSRPEAFADDMDERGGAVNHFVVTNVSFVCDATIMQLALTELLKFERGRQASPADMENLRTAEVFLSRTK